MKRGVLISFKKVIIILIGLFISSFGTSFLYTANLGATPSAVCYDGLHNVMGISYGLANLIINLVILLFIFIYRRKLIHVGTILCTFMIGIFIDIGTNVLSTFDSSTMSIALRLTFCVLGSVLMGVGLGIYVSVDYGLGPLEALVEVIIEKTKLPYNWAKRIFDLLFAVIGYILGGTVGIGTVIAIIILGSAMQMTINFCKRLSQKQKAFNK